MAEASEGKAELEDVDEETFGLFIQFAYTGTYFVPGSGDLEETTEPANSGKLYEQPRYRT
jgi:hypothetical protein